MKRPKIIIAAGGTGGHLLPARQLSLALKESADLLFVGHGLGESPFFCREQFPFHPIEAAPLNGLLRFAAISCRSICQSLSLLRSYRSDLVVGFGSFHVFPILTASLLVRKKIILFEANCQLGKVNRLFAPFASLVAAQFPLNGKIEPVPLLPWKENGFSRDRISASVKFGLDPAQLTCLIFGGSQGALFLNRIAPLALPSNIQAIHLVGKEDRVEEVSNLYAKRGIRAFVKAYEDEMESAYAAADFALCRSGASTIAELIAHELPALLIPYPFSTDAHQIANALFLAKNIGGGIMMLEKEADLNSLPQAIQSLIESREERQKYLGIYRKECAGRESFAARIMREI